MEEEEILEIDEGNLRPPTLIVGERCACKVASGTAEEGNNNNERLAQVMFIGMLPQPMPRGYWVGVMYDLKVGKNDGTLNGRKYFQCPPGHGGFVRPTKVKDLNEQKRREEAAERLAEEARLKRQKDKSRKAKDDDGGASDGDGGQRRGGSGGVDEVGGRQEVEVDASTTAGADNAVALVSLEEGVSGGGAAARPPRRTSLTDAPRARAKPSTRRVRASRTERSGGGSGGMAAEVTAAVRLRASRCRASGTGLTVAQVGTLAQFTLSLADEAAATERAEAVSTATEVRQRHPHTPPTAPSFAVLIRGRASLKDSQPMTIRAKLIDRGDGTFQCEYKPWMSGHYHVEIALDGAPIRGSPWMLNVITARPEAAQCVVRGEGLKEAVSRKPQKFEVEFVDARGHPSHAEELDVYIEYLGLPSGAPSLPLSSILSATDGDGEGLPTVGAPKAVPTADELKAAAAVAAYEAQLVAPPPERIECKMVECKSVDADAAAQADGTAADAAAGAQSRPAAPSDVVGPAIATACFHPLDAFARQRHDTLWASRASADKWLTKRAAEKQAKRKQFTLVPSTSHELSEADPFGFAYGGLTPGLLHSHGRMPSRPLSNPAPTCSPHAAHMQRAAAAALCASLCLPAVPAVPAVRCPLPAARCPLPRSPAFPRVPRHPPSVLLLRGAISLTQLAASPMITPFHRSLQGSHRPLLGGARRTVQPPRGASSAARAAALLTLCAHCLPRRGVCSVDPDPAGEPYADRHGGRGLAARPTSPDLGHAGQPLQRGRSARRSLSQPRVAPRTPRDRSSQP